MAKKNMLFVSESVKINYCLELEILIMLNLFEIKYKKVYIMVGLSNHYD